MMSRSPSGPQPSRLAGCLVISCGREKAAEVIHGVPHGSTKHPQGPEQDRALSPGQPAMLKACPGSPETLCGLGAGGRGGREKQEQLQGWGWLAAAEGSRPQQSAGTGAGWEQHSPYSSWKEAAHQKHPAASSPASTAAALPAGSNRASGVRTSCLALSWLGGKLLSSCIINFKGHCPFKMNNLPSKGFISPRSRTPTSLDLQPHRHEMYF